MGMVDRAVYHNSSSASEEDLKIRFSSPLDRRTGKIRVWGEMAPGGDPHSVSFSSKHQRFLHFPYLEDQPLREMCELRFRANIRLSKAHVLSAPETHWKIQTTMTRKLVV